VPKEAFQFTASLMPYHLPSQGIECHLPTRQSSPVCLLTSTHHLHYTLAYAFIHWISQGKKKTTTTKKKKTTHTNQELYKNTAIPQFFKKGQGEGTTAVTLGQTDYNQNCFYTATEVFSGNLIQVKGKLRDFVIIFGND